MPRNDGLLIADCSAEPIEKWLNPIEPEEASFQQEQKASWAEAFCHVEITPVSLNAFSLKMPAN